MAGFRNSVKVNEWNKLMEEMAKADTEAERVINFSHQYYSSCCLISCRSELHNCVATSNWIFNFTIPVFEYTEKVIRTNHTGCSKRDTGTCHRISTLFHSGVT